MQESPYNLSPWHSVMTDTTCDHVILIGLICSRNRQVWRSSGDRCPRVRDCECDGGRVLVSPGPEALRHREEDVRREGEGLAASQGPGF